MKHHRRGGFQELDERLIIVAILVMMAAILLPVCLQSANQAARHNHNTTIAVFQAIGFTIAGLLALFVLVPLLLALPCASIAKLTIRRSETFSNLLERYYGNGAGGAFISLWVGGFFLLLWDMLVKPIMHFLAR